MTRVANDRIRVQKKICQIEGLPIKVRDLNLYRRFQLGNPSLVSFELFTNSYEDPTIRGFSLESLCQHFFLGQQNLQQYEREFNLRRYGIVSTAGALVVVTV